MLKRFVGVLSRFSIQKKKAQSLVEYGLILALVSVVAITVLQTMGTQIKNTVGGINTKLEQATNGNGN